MEEINPITYSKLLSQYVTQEMFQNNIELVFEEKTFLQSMKPKEKLSVEELESLNIFDPKIYKTDQLL